MDLYKTIRDLLEERKRLDAIISRLERVQVADAGKSSRQPQPKRRGRKGMSAAERKQVSERMRKYWESRRSEAKRSAAGSATS